VGQKDLTFAIKCAIVKECEASPTQNIKERKGKVGQKVEEVKDKEGKLKEALAGALENTKAYEPLTPEFDTAYAAYLTLKAELAKVPSMLELAGKQDREDATRDLCNQLAAGIEQLIVGLEVDKAQGEPIIALRYAQDSTGAGFVVLNPITKLKAKALNGVSQGPSTRPWIVDAKGNRLTVGDFCRPYCPTKYPHKAVRNQAEFDAFCQKNGLAGYTYVAGKAIV